MGGMCVFQEGQRLLLFVGVHRHEVYLLLNAGLGSRVVVPTVKRTCCVGVSWHKTFYWSIELGSAVQNGIAKIQVIEHLSLSGRSREIADRVFNRNGRYTTLTGERCFQLKFGKVKP